MQSKYKIIMLLPAFPLLGIYPEKTLNSKRSMHPKAHCSTVYKSQDMEAPKCILTEEWIRKMWYRYTVEFHSVIKKNEIMPFVTTWMYLEVITLIEVRQKEKDRYHSISLTCGISKNDTNELISKTETDS